VPSARRYRPSAFVVARPTGCPLRQKTSVTPLAGAEHGSSAVQTGVIGPRMTTPQRPLELVLAAAEPARTTAAAQAVRNQRIHREDRRNRGKRNGAGVPAGPVLLANYLLRLVVTASAC